MSDYETRTIAVMVNKPDEPTFSVHGTEIRIDDEAGGEYLRLKQSGDELGVGEICIETDQWPTIREALDRMISECRDN